MVRFTLTAVQAFCFRYPLTTPVVTSFGRMLAGIGGDGMLEVDSNDNPLRDEFCGPVADIDGGRITLTDAPGLGFTPDLASIERYRTA